MIEVTHKNHVATVYLNDAPFNGIGEAIVEAATNAITALLEDDNTRVIVLTGKGKFFSAGGNLKTFMDQADPGAYIDQAIRDVFNPFGLFLRNLAKPLICAVNGPAVGAGVGLALTADITVAAKSAYFALPFVPKLGVVPDLGASWQVTRSLNYSQALALTLTGESLSAEAAEAAGMIWRCTEDDELADYAQELAEKLASNSPAAIRRGREMIRAATENSYQEQLELERKLQAESFAGSAFQEGLRAFAEKRPADFITHGED